MRSLLRAGLALGLVAAACKDSIAPKSLADPRATTAQMAALDSLFGASTLNSFSALAPQITPVAPAPVAILQAVTAASNPLTRSSALRPYAKGLESARMVRALVPTFTAAAAGDLFPPAFDGKTFEWNVTTHAYDTTARAGAPPQGVRFILYAVDPLTHLPVEPLVEVGYADLDDESTATVAKLHVTVAGVNGTPIYVDYRVTIESTSQASERITTTGFITNGTGAPDTLQFHGVITAAGSAASATITQDVSLDVNSRDLHVRLVETVTLTQTSGGLSVGLRIAFRFQHGAEVVTLEGNFTVDEAAQTANGSITVKVDGGRMATCTVTASADTYNLTCQGADADGLNADEQEALQAIGDAVGKVQEVFNGLFGPPLGVLGV